MQSNQLRLRACIAGVEPLRYTPAGLPAVNLVLEHGSQQEESGSVRTVKLELKAVAFGAQAERLVRQTLGSVWMFRGFLAQAPRGKTVVFHIQDFLQD